VGSQTLVKRFDLRRASSPATVRQAAYGGCWRGRSAGERQALKQLPRGRVLEPAGANRFVCCTDLLRQATGAGWQRLERGIWLLSAEMGGTG